MVSTFAVVGDSWKPKTFGGLFGAAPSVAVATLGIAVVEDGTNAASVEARWMAIGSIAMVAYSVACIVACRFERIPVWLAAALSWAIWIAVAVGLHALLEDLV
jgi:hypothetical protein